MIDSKEIFTKNIQFWGDKVQSILKKSSVLIAGCGGLGSVVSSNLVRSGIGKLILIDYDFVEVTNLNRQILYNTGDVGENKVTTTKNKLEKINPFCKIEIINNELSKIKDLHSYKFNGIADCLDNFPSRYILEKNLTTKSFLVHGGVTRDFGQITTIIPNKTKKMQEIFQGSENYNEEGIIPQIVNIIGSLMSYEIINNLIGNPKLLNKILVFELEDFSTNIIDLSRDAPTCVFGNHENEQGK